MSRSGYCDDYYEGIELWRGTVKRTINGKRGQAFLREMRDALDAMPEKKLIVGELVCEDGVCAMGAVAVARSIDTAEVSPDDRDGVASLFGISGALAAEIAFENDEGYHVRETPEQRWRRMRQWVEQNIRPESPTK